MSPAFRQRLLPHLPAIAAHFGTPFHIYDAQGILDGGARLNQAFSAFRAFREYYAVKALPNPAVLSLLRALGFGFDCSSSAELILARQVGALGEDITFTSNNTSADEFSLAFADGACLLNLDDLSLLDKLPHIPDLLCFRYNPGAQRQGNAIIGKPEEAKYGVAQHQILDAYRRAQALGVRRFGIHTMLVSNERDPAYLIETARMLLDVVAHLSAQLSIRFEFINIGGGFGIPYRPDEAPLALDQVAQGILAHFQAFEATHGYQPALHMECGRYITGAHGVLVTRAINHKDTYRRYIGVDASMSALMRPAMYGAYHHLEVYGKEDNHDLDVVDVVGALCENNDKFAIQRPLPPIQEGDLLLIHDTGAHGHAMGFNYNGRLRPQELLLHADGTVTRIRRAETLADYFATLTYEARTWSP